LGKLTLAFRIGFFFFAALCGGKFTAKNTKLTKTYS